MQHLIRSLGAGATVACTRFRIHRVRCFYGTGGGSWRDEGLRGEFKLEAVRRHPKKAAAYFAKEST